MNGVKNREQRRRSIFVGPKYMYIRSYLNPRRGGAEVSGELPRGGFSTLGLPSG